MSSVVPVPAMISYTLLKKSIIPLSSSLIPIRLCRSSSSLNSLRNVGRGCDVGRRGSLSVLHVHNQPGPFPEIFQGKAPTELPPSLPDYVPTSTPPELPTSVPIPGFSPVGPVPQEVPADPPPGSPSPNPGPDFPELPIPSPPMPDTPMPNPEVPTRQRPDVIPSMPPEVDPPPTGPPDMVPPPSAPPIYHCRQHPTIKEDKFPC